MIENLTFQEPVTLYVLYRIQYKQTDSLFIEQYLVPLEVESFMVVLTQEGVL